MDFGSLLYAAHKNDKTTNKDIKCYKTKFEPPKKEIKSKTNLSANIQKYLQKREQDDRRKAEEERRKKEELLVLRSQDRKSFKRVQTMLKNTKSANRSVLEDARDEVNTAVTMAGPQQCDEDDYGYVSQEASAFYAKLMDKYSNTPAEEPKFPQEKKPVVKDLNAAKDRVRAALQREEEEEMMPHKRKRKSKSEKYEEEAENDQKEEKHSREPSPVNEPKKKIPKKAAPPPLDFSQLLKIAEKKQFEPIQIEKKVNEEDNGRPMTKKEKIEYERERERINRKMEREKSMQDGKRKTESTTNRIPKVSGASERKDGLSGLGRIPKKKNPVESSAKFKSINENVKRKDSIDSDNAHNYSENERTRQNSLQDSGRLRNALQARHDQASKSSKSESNRDRTNHKSEMDKYSRTNGTVTRKSSFDSDNYSDNEQPRNDTQYDRNQQRNNQSSRNDQVKKSYQSDSNCYQSDSNHYQSDSNRIRNSHQSDRMQGSLSKSSGRKPMKSAHSISENKAKFRNHNISEDEQSDASVENTKSSSFSSSMNKQQKSDRPTCSNPIKRKNYPEKNSFSKNVTDNELSDSQSGTYSKEYRSEKYSGNSTHKKKPEVKYKSEKEIFNRHKEEKNFYSREKSNCGDYSGESNNNRSPSPERARYSESHRRSSYSDSEPEQKKKYIPEKKLVSSTNKAKKINSLFEGSKEEYLSDHERYQKKKEIETKKSKVFDYEREKISQDESKSRFPKSSSKFDSNRTKETERVDKPRSSENRGSSSSSSKTQFTKQGTKSLPNINRYDKPQSMSNTSVDKTKDLDKIKGRPSSNVESLKKDKRSEIVEKPNAEEMLKKNASVWSKPCNLPPSKPNPSGLSESQLERLRQMNKKPTPTLREERKPDGRSMPLKPITQGKPSLLQAAAAAAAARSANKTQASSYSRDSEPKPKGDQQPASRPSVNDSSRSKQPGATSNRPSDGASKSSRPKLQSSSDAKPKQFPPSDLKPKQFPPRDLKPKQFPPSDLKPRAFPPKDVSSRQFPPPDVKRKPTKPRRIVDSSEEDEYDSEMDDFIDDGTDMNHEQISQEIRSIFGYDKNKYLGLDDEDDECMESNFGQIDQEEYRSLRIGAQEDYIELMRDLAEKKRKKQKKIAMIKGKS